MAGMLISGLPPRAYVHIEFLNTAVHRRGGDVIQSAAAPAAEASKGGRDRHGRSRE